MPGKKPQEIIKEAGGLEKYYDKYDEVFDKDRGQAFYSLETTVVNLRCILSEFLM